MSGFYHDGTEKPVLGYSTAISTAETLTETLGSDSLDDTQDESVEAAWDEEAARRMADIDSGAGRPISLEEARRRLSSALE